MTEQPPRLPREQLLYGSPDYLDDHDGFERLKEYARTMKGHDMAPININSLSRLIDTVERLRAAWNTRTPPPVDAELVEVAAKAVAMSKSQRIRGNDREWKVYLCEVLRKDVTAVIAAIAPAIRSQERAKIVAWLRDGALYRDWKRASFRLRIKAAWLSFRRPWTFAKSACETQLATAIEQGTHDNE